MFKKTIHSSSFVGFIQSSSCSLVFISSTQNFLRVKSTNNHKTKNKRGQGTEEKKEEKEIFVHDYVVLLGSGEHLVHEHTPHFHDENLSLFIQHRRKLYQHFCRWCVRCYFAHDKVNQSLFFFS